MSKSWPEVRNRLAAIFRDRPHRAAIAVLLCALAVTLGAWLIVMNESALDTQKAYFVLGAGLAIALLLFLVVNGQAALSESEKRTRDILAAASDALVSVDKNGFITEWNAQAEKIFGWSRTEAIGSPLVETIIPREQAYGLGLKRLLETGEAPVLNRRIELSALHRDGSEFPIELTIWATGSVRPGFNAFITDISECKHNERELAETRARLAASVAALEQRNRESACLTELNSVLQSCSMLAEAFEPIVKAGHQLLPRDDGVLYFAGGSHHEVEAAAYWGNPIILSKSPGPVECWSLRRGRLHRVDDPANGHLCGHVTPESVRPYLCVPLIAQNRMLGFIHLVRRENTAPFDESTEKLASAFAEQVSLALTNLKLRETLRHESNHDPLTGLYNRRYLESALRYELSRAKRKKAGALTVLMLDIDHFKQYNDKLGHAAGDAALQAVARRLKSKLRDYDVPCRYGGEEFVVILPDTVAEDAVTWAEKFRELVAHFDLKHEGRLLDRITVSIGVANYPEHGDEAKALLKAADQALYAAKANGRNQVIVYSAVIAGVGDLTARFI
ncbi:MAG: diguanylate cyclase [Burkholderiales bacterium]